MLNNSTILITGGTGSFGRHFLKLLLRSINSKKVIIYSRDMNEMTENAQGYKNDERARFLLAM